MTLVRYPGGKSKLKKHILPFIPSLNGVEYREPFVGGGSIFLSIIEKESISKFIINDFDVQMGALWQSVIYNPLALIDRIKSYIPTVDSYLQFVESLNTSETLSVLELGFRKLAVHQMSYSGLGLMAGGPIGGNSQSSKYVIGCRWSPLRLEKTILKISELTKHLDSDKKIISSLDFESVISRDSTLSTFIYLDPPYYDKGADMYVHSFKTNDHIRLANVLKKTPHKWLLSYDDCPEVRELYSWAKVSTFSAKYSITSVIGEDDTRKSTNKNELLIQPI